MTHCPTRVGGATAIAAALLLLSLLASVAIAPRALAAETAPAPPRHWVFLRDKGVADPAAALAALEGEWDARSLARRRLRRTAPGLLDARDLPIAPAHRAAIEATGARIHLASRWLNAVSVVATPAERRRLAALPIVTRIEPVRQGRRRDAALPGGGGGAAPEAPAGGGAAWYGLAWEQLEQIQATGLHARGATGAGVVVAILDTGFQRTHVAFNHPAHPLAVVAEWDFVDDDPETGPEPGDAPTQHVHGTYILGTLAGYDPGNYVGTAYDASFVLCKTEDVADETPIEEDNYVAGLEFAELHGADVATSSLGYIDWYAQSDLDGLTATTTIAMNVATTNGMHCCTAAGNGGNDEDPATSALIAPSDAFEVITCGAVWSSGEIASFSSDGPTADGRVKPELLARGVDTHTVRTSSDVEYTDVNGTSLSTPLVAGLVACLVQARPAWDVAAMRSFLIATAEDQVANGMPDPLFVRGHGIVRGLDAALADCDGDGTPGGCSCPGDADGDGEVRFDDLVALLGTWGPCAVCPADFDGDGAVAFTDLTTLLAGWGPCD